MNTLQKFIQSKPFGFLTEADLAELIKLDRLFPVLVRCGGKRFTCAAQDCAEMIKAIEAAGDYVRDVSCPVGSLERAANWKPEGGLATVIYRSANLRAANLIAPSANRKTGAPPFNYSFNENDCGGAFDGHQVTSDADSGL